ncbi:MAG: hypothetical protein LKI94_02140 [Sporolactobacillus sp.]|nr:hypothetical protein [Sporolactobacillus sp.]MCI1880976.1 hypothetical protein [Sporolactobacillus sp.]
MILIEAIIRKAAADDATAIREVACVTWHATYKNLLPETAQDRFLSAAYSNRSLAPALPTCFSSLPNGTAR